MNTVKLQIAGTDRVGIVANIATVMSDRGANILSMEVEVVGDRAIVYLEAQLTPPLDLNELLTGLRTIASLTEISPIHTLPLEKREKRVQIVLDNIRDGILAVDETGKITMVNQVAREILGTPEDDLIGRELRALELSGSRILDCLTGPGYRQVNRDLITERGRFQFLATGKPIRDSRGQVVGAVEILKELREIKEMAHAVSHPLQVTFREIIGSSPALRDVISIAQKLARTDPVVSLRGESGTGKELFASAIHAESGRPGPFVPVNCAALPETLLESELFGYAGGAFTGARREGKPGLFEIAQDGTLFLDEIAEIPLTLQAKMLRVLQERRVRRIGGTREMPVNVRIITATNKNLERMMDQGLFREDLYYRINVFQIQIPALRERIEDIGPLAEHFLFHLNSTLGKTAQRLAPAALAKLAGHRWPGNIRELRNVIERASILCPGAVIEAEHVLFGAGAPAALAGEALRSDTEQPGDSLGQQVDQFERQVISQRLQMSGSIREAARALGVSHTTLLNKIKKLGLTLAR
ncbi:Fis family transcriptional regulator [Geomonas limicola]|uniref:HTH-type transcriptional regulatory protein TyrR n=1 Tax=Geomonas limicola TaxID=2740186 RepID=A0A6V8N300_9BACT|nr:sigma 54-interacting transcriptional regulator [Geomonas limicola]GFO66876.1 Fis family transcriptional regulator [Geomonas limicola]